MVFRGDYRRRRDAPHSRSVMSTRAVTPGVRHGANRLSDARLPLRNMGTRSWEGNKTATSAALHIPRRDGVCAFDAETTRQRSFGAAGSQTEGTKPE